MMTHFQPTTAQIFEVTEALPEHLHNWLNTVQPHSIFATVDWFEALISFKRNEPLSTADFYWLVVFKDSDPCIAAPIEKNGKKLKLISNFYTPYIDIFYQHQTLSAKDAWSLLLHHLSLVSANWQSLEVSPLTLKQLSTLSDLQQHNNISVFPYHFSANFSTDIPDFNTYWASRSSRLKNTLQRRKKLLGEDNLDIQVYSSLSAEQYQSYWHIYELSWKAQEPSRDFINWLMQWAEKSEKLQLGILTINGIAAACQLWLVDSGTAYIFKLAQDKATDKYSPGTILTEHMIRMLNEVKGVKRLDFLLGDDAFKKLWMAERNNIMGAEIINRSTMRGQILARFYLLRDFIKRHTGVNFSFRRLWHKLVSKTPWHRE